MQIAYQNMPEWAPAQCSPRIWCTFLIMVNILTCHSAFFFLSRVVTVEYQLNHCTKWVVNNQLIIQPPRDCPGPLPTYLWWCSPTYGGHHWWSWTCWWAKTVYHNTVIVRPSRQQTMWLIEKLFVHWTQSVTIFCKTIKTTHVAQCVAQCSTRYVVAPRSACQVKLIYTYFLHSFPFAFFDDSWSY